jgi:hypothetical protein
LEEEVIGSGGARERESFGREERKRERKKKRGLQWPKRYRRQ